MLSSLATGFGPSPDLHNLLLELHHGQCYSSGYGGQLKKDAITVFVPKKETVKKIMSTWQLTDHVKKRFIMFNTARLYWVSQKKLLHKSEGKTALKKEDDLVES